MTISGRGRLGPPRPSCAGGARGRRPAGRRRSSRSPTPARAGSRGESTRPALFASSHSRRNSVRVRRISSPPRRTVPASGVISSVPNAMVVGSPLSVPSGPAQQGPDAGGELLGLERLGDVVVGARLEPGHDVVAVGPGRHHDDRHVALAPQPPAQLEAVHAGQHDVDEHDVRRARRRASRAASSRAADIGDGIALVLEREPEGGADALVVLDDQDAGGHPAMMPSAGAWRTWG